MSTNPNSIEAFKKQTPNKKEADKNVILRLLAIGDYTCKEIEARTCLLHQTASARIYDLMKDQKITIRGNKEYQAVYGLRDKNDPLNVFKKTFKEKTEFLISILTPDQFKRYEKFEKGKCKMEF